jgi:hypothetical protein
MPIPEAPENPMRVVAILLYDDHSTDLSMWIGFSRGILMLFRGFVIS